MNVNGKPNQRRPEDAPRDPEPGWVRWWRTHPQGRPFPHVETKGTKKRTRRERRAAKGGE